MKAYKFIWKDNDYQYTTLFAVEIVDNDLAFGDDGDPVEIALPRGFKKYGSKDALIGAIVSSEVVGFICSCRIFKFHNKLVTVIYNHGINDLDMVLVLDFKNKGAIEEFKKDGHWGDYENLGWNYET